MNVRIVTLAYLITFSLWPNPRAAAQDKIRLGLSSIGATHGSIWVAEEKGLFKKNGVEVEVIFLGGGGAPGRQRAARRRYSVFRGRR